MLQRYVFQISIVVLMLLFSVVANAQSFAGDINECLPLGEIEIKVLPSNLRIVVDDVDELILLDLFNNINTPIPNSSYISEFTGGEYAGMPLLYHQDQRMLVVEASTWLSMDIDGHNATIATASPDWYEIKLNNDGLSLYRDLETDEYQILNVTTGEITGFDYPKLIDYVRLYETRLPQESAINPIFDYIAYLAHDVDSQTGKIMSKVIRVQHIPSGDYFDISSEMINKSSITATYLRWKSNYVLGLVAPNDDTEYIFDVASQEIVLQIQPPSSRWNFWLPTFLSPSNNIFATLFETNEENKTYIVELQDLQDGYIECLQIKRVPTAILSNNCFQCGNNFNWTYDSRYLWWLECNTELVGFGRCEDTYRLMLFDLETNQYGVLLHDVGIKTRIGFID